MEQGVHRFRVTAGGVHAHLELDGHPIDEGVRAYTIEQAAGGPPRVVLFLAESHQVEFDGLARVVVGVPPEPGPSAVAFLEAIDPAELERAALARTDLDNEPHAVARAVLRQLTEWASGA